MRLVADIATLDTPGLFASAQRRIILHAAVYGAFARSQPHRQGLDAALARPHFERLDIIALEPGCPESWVRPFLDAMRFGISRQATEDEVAASHAFVSELAARNPGRVAVHPARRLPCLPMLVIDDTIVFGQYAHAGCHAPQGFWGMVHADVPALLDWAETGKPPSHASPEEVAAFRLVNECVRAMQAARSPSLTPCNQRFSPQGQP
ncbi:hypothetical protein GKC30_08985 [Pseudodesulfovibrio sp. F-1]|uniref:Uncharacterized protein n=1 Tax=Pseudodesulfovibrio alkaliphilus TaxID=2661613 RepID=A0A7K1KNU0_9BACT|nr:hypothetical protein [Pseudodesulfovibrio alkaliphilus]MUM77766.1 hypothetical protein [Pseudodesulfovibrio alkaliphilus]